MQPIPTLTTSRLTLRPMRFDDWPAYRQLMASERAQFMGGPFSDAAAWGMFCSDYAQWDLLGCGALMIEDQASGACIGQVGINAGPLFPEFELGWFVYPEFEGRGYAREAAETLLSWARDIQKLPSLVSYVDPENTRSAGLALRLGAVLDPSAERPAPEDLVYRHYPRVSA
ncbi:N-acetyltransferase GCN5 [Agrobacterium albertimagni AOL15]|uniref:N-acetyltransferase GCN5 n=1 Tax=Agrobacterium albertimagni AOL15 TaxID=1156935 RepID=K2Q8F0_9HYPH|nr:GNAT family N-acetyltransferase [Agrobacterium albertimagni]EKF60069.1 N-acetyltransferase GCN5 [Agrobacterium albertimagni AOL15]